MALLCALDILHAVTFRSSQRPKVLYGFECIRGVVIFTVLLDPLASVVLRRRGCPSLPYVISFHLFTSAPTTTLGGQSSGEANGTLGLQGPAIPVGCCNFFEKH